MSSSVVLLLVLLVGTLAEFSTWNEDKWEESTATWTTRRRRNDATLPTLPPAPPAGSIEYTFELTMSVKTFGESPDATLSAQVVGDKVSDWAILGKGWTKDMMGKVITKTVRLMPVGDPVELVLRTDSTDGVAFDTVIVTPADGKPARFDTQGAFLRCRKNDFFGSKETKKSCDATFKVSTAVLGGGVTSLCTMHKTTGKAVTSDFKPPPGGLRIDYSGFTVYMDCAKHAAYRFEYTAQNDCGKLARKGGFSLDPKIPKTCQQTNGKAYPTTQGVAFDRGHQVPANHLDADQKAIVQSNFMTNILPQAANMNRGAWLLSEEIIECLRVEEALYVVGGAVFDKNYARYNWFMKSHNVANPSFFWKIIKAQTLHPETGNVLALWIPNSEQATRGNLDSYVVSVTQLELNLAKYFQPQVFNLRSTVKSIWPQKAWGLPQGCDKSL